MIKIENIDVWGFEHAVRGMRNPLNSWDKSDSREINFCNADEVSFYIGDNDLNLMKKLYQAGTEHRKYLRQIFVSMDITAPLYWWKEFDTYKVGTVANSCSTMHKIASKEFTIDDFSNEHIIDYCIDIECGHAVIPEYCLEAVIDILELCRERYLETKDKKWWWQMIQLLPSSYNQKRTITMNYENVVTILKQREGHKLDEWNTFCVILREFPYIEDITRKE